MWIVRFALQRPFTFVIVAVLIAIFGIASILRTPTDILPDIDIPIVSVIWTYGGLDADDMSKRIAPRHCMRLESSSSYQYKTGWQRQILELTRRFYGNNSCD